MEIEYKLPLGDAWTRSEDVRSSAFRRKFVLRQGVSELSTNFRLEAELRTLF